MIKVVVGIDIGGTNTAIGFVDKNGEIHKSLNLPTEKYSDANKYINDISALLLNENSKEFKIIGVGIGAPNGNFYTGTIDYAPNLKFKGVFPIASMLQNRLDVPVLLTNDANAAAIGEQIFGGAQNMKDFVTITLGTGVGSGIVANGQIIYGHDGFAGEIGHSIVIPEGRLCACGRKGCLEAYACARGIKQTALEILKQNNKYSLLRTFDEKDITSKIISEAALQGDEIALEVFEYTGKILGLKLSDTVAHLNPEAIFIFGGVAKAGDLLFVPTKKYMEQYLLNIFKGKVKILPSEIQDKNAAILGASALIWKENELNQ